MRIPITCKVESNFIIIWPHTKHTFEHNLKDRVRERERETKLHFWCSNNACNFNSVPLDLILSISFLNLLKSSHFFPKSSHVLTINLTWSLKLSDGIYLMLKFDRWMTQVIVYGLWFWRLEYEINTIYCIRIKLKLWQM